MRILKATVCLCAVLSTAQRPRLSTCPSDMVLARPGVCIDRYEWPNKKGARPSLAQSAVSYELGPLTNAEDFCAYNDKRTCTRSEWVAACRGAGGSDFPYGKKYEAGKCNVEKKWRSVNPYKVMTRDQTELNRLDQSEPSGSRDECISSSGAADMVGNAEEWVRCDNGQEAREPWYQETRWCLVGGFWADPRSSCTYVITKHVPDWHYYETGFRCCLDISNSEK